MRAVNLIPVEQRSGQSVGVGRSQGAAYAVIVLIAGFAIMAYSYGKADHQISSGQKQVAALNEQAQQDQAAAERLAPYTSFISQREARTAAVQTLIDSRFDWAHVFHEFGRVLPGGVAVTSLNGSIAGATSTTASSSSSTSSTASGASAGGAPTFTIAGCATSQRTVALTLQRLRLMDGVKEVTLQNSTATGETGAGPSSGGSGSSCPGGDPVFNAVVNFEPLPSPATVAAATRTVSDASAAGASAAASAAASTSTGAGTR